MASELFDMTQWDFALRRYQPEKDFLREIILEDIKEKINDHQRAFSKIAVIAKKASCWVQDLNLEAEAVEIGDQLHFTRTDYDLILHLGALHRMNDPIGQMVQARTHLQPDGVFMAGFLGGDSLQELRWAFHQAEAKIYNGTSPHVAPMIEIKDAGHLLARAGFALPVSDTVKQQVRYASFDTFLKDLRSLALTNPLLARRKGFTRATLFISLHEIYRENFSLETGQITASFELIFLTGYAPSNLQPKPLRPGSVQTPFGSNMEN